MASLAATAALHAQDAGESYGARAKVKAPIAATSSEDPTAAGTTLEVQGRSGALETLDEVIAASPGARVQSTGGYGAFAAVSLRGAGSEHTTVLFDALPLNTADTGPFDLSLVPLSALESVEVYRGGAPAWWGDGSIGGVVRLQPRRAAHSMVSALGGCGSFGRCELAVSSAAARDDGARPSFFAHVEAAHADNDYPYVDDGQTLFDTQQMAATADDVATTQQNARIDAANALAHAGIDAAGGRLEVVLLAHERNEGIPGPLLAPTQNARRNLARVLGAASWTTQAFGPAAERRYRLQVMAGGNLQRHRITDLDGELGLSTGTAADNAWSRGFLRAASSFALTSFLEPTLIASFARDDYRPEDALAFSAPPRPSGRTSEALAAELRLHGALGRTRWELRPSVRGQWSQTSIWVQDSAGTGMRMQRDDVEPTARIAATIAPWQALAFSASASTGTRLPSILELFGDRALQLPNTDLLPERSRSVDVSAVLRGRSGELAGSAELRGFALFIDDMITYRRTAQYTVRPENIDRGRIYGIEAGTQGAYGRHLSLSGSVTALHTQNQFDKRLPLRAPLQLMLRPEVAVFPEPFDRVVFFAEAAHTSFFYLDPGNRTFLEGRTVCSLGSALLFWQQRATLKLRAENVLDAEATDVLSRPLPGFNFMVSLGLQETL